jgi:hypothetical protein
MPTMPKHPPLASTGELRAEVKRLEETYYKASYALTDLEAWTNQI